MSNIEKQPLDWANLDFSYHTTSMRYVANYRNGKWEQGGLTEDPNVVLNECAGIFHYCQEVFEGLKAYETKQGHIVTFRPDLNAQRMYDSAQLMQIPPFPQEWFLHAVDEVVKANASWVPPHESGASLYIRPYIIASGEVIGVAPAKEYMFRILTTPVGPYFKGGVRPLKLCVSKYDRAAPHGTGMIKAGLNYAMSLHAYVEAHKAGFDENMFLDPATRTYVEETGGANFLFVTRDKEIVIPKSPSILPSITRRSLTYVAEHYAHHKVTERPVRLEEVKDFVECGLCGTAAVIAPVGRVFNGDEEIVFKDCADRMGPVLQNLYDTLIGIQHGTIEAPEGWIRKIL